MRLTSMVFIMLLGTVVILCSILIHIRKVTRQKGLRQKKLSLGKKLKNLNLQTLLVFNRRHRRRYLKNKNISDLPMHLKMLKQICLCQCPYIQKLYYNVYGNYLTKINPYWVKGLEITSKVDVQHRGLLTLLQSDVN